MPLGENIFTKWHQRSSVNLCSVSNIAEFCSRERVGLPSSMALMLGISDNFKIVFCRAGRNLGHSSKNGQQSHLYHTSRNLCLRRDYHTYTSFRALGINLIEERICNLCDNINMESELPFLCECESYVQWHIRHVLFIKVALLNEHFVSLDKNKLKDILQFCNN